MTTKHIKFDDWSEAQEWADETDKVLESVGTFTGEEHIVEERTEGDTHIAMWERTAEVLAIGKFARQIIHVKEHLVVTTTGQHKEIEYCDSWQDAYDTIWTAVTK